MRLFMADIFVGFFSLVNNQLNFLEKDLIRILSLLRTKSLIMVKQHKVVDWRTEKREEKEEK